jgi:hypothetical protein
MKKILMIIGIAGCIAAGGCEVDGYVTDQPADVYYVRPAAPGPEYVWIDGDWVWGGGGYRWHEGYWGHPRSGQTWERGHWEHGEKGYRWNRGHWK